MADSRKKKDNISSLVCMNLYRIRRKDKVG